MLLTIDFSAYEMYTYIQYECNKKELNYRKHLRLFKNVSQLILSDVSMSTNNRIQGFEKREHMAIITIPGFDYR